MLTYIKLMFFLKDLNVNFLYCLNTTCSLGRHHNEFIVTGALRYIYLRFVLNTHELYMAKLYKLIMVMIGRACCIKIIYIYWVRPDFFRSLDLSHSSFVIIYSVVVVVVVVVYIYIYIYI